MSARRRRYSSEADGEEGLTEEDIDRVNELCALTSTTSDYGYEVLDELEDLAGKAGVEDVRGRRPSEWCGEIRNRLAWQKEVAGLESGLAAIALGGIPSPRGYGGVRVSRAARPYEVAKRIAERGDPYERVVRLCDRVDRHVQTPEDIDELVDIARLLGLDPEVTTLKELCSIARSKLRSTETIGQRWARRARQRGYRARSFPARLR